MEWRCEWCGKPHAENDPPCDNCGHGTFERAVVRGAPAAESEGPSTTVWVCPECGRAHPKNSPPCSRCGHGKLELEERSIDDYGDVGAPSYRDLLTRRYALGLVAALGLAAVFVLGVMGIVPIPGLTPQGLEVAGVPGNASVAAGIDLAEVETAYLDALNERRSAENLRTVGPDTQLAEVTTFFNERSIKEALTDADLPSTDTAAERLRDSCSSEPEVWQLRQRGLTIDGFANAAGLSEALLERSRFGSEAVATESAPKTGVDVHIGPDGTVYVLQLVC
ncbi:MAG: hypothetical protein V5A43_09855 [Haloarculaceae archaeon]